MNRHPATGTASTRRPLLPDHVPAPSPDALHAACPSILTPPALVPASRRGHAGVGNNPSCVRARRRDSLRPLRCVPCDALRQRPPRRSVRHRYRTPVHCCKGQEIQLPRPSRPRGHNVDYRAFIGPICEPKRGRSLTSSDSSCGDAIRQCADRIRWPVPSGLTHPWAVHSRREVRAILRAVREFIDGAK